MISDVSDISAHYGGLLIILIFTAMNKNFEDYLKAILEHYEVVKNGKNADLLENPTPGNLKKLCLQLLEKGLNNADEKAFLNFFHPKEDRALYAHIRNMSTDGLRTPSDFLRLKQGLTNNRQHANLVAVLIDFEPRPFVKFQDIIQEEKEKEELSKKDILKEKEENTQPIAEAQKEELQSVEEAIGKEKIVEEEKQKEDFTETETVVESQIEQRATHFANPVDNSPKATTRRKTAFIALAVILFVSLTGFFIHRSTEPKCMIWKEDHYEMIDCEQETAMGLFAIDKIRPYNEALFEGMRKIIPTDTSTFFNGEDPVLHYSKRNNECEFFTMPGKHPVTGKDLHPVSRLIVQKYVLGWKDKE